MKKGSTWVNKYIELVCANELVDAQTLKENNLPISLFKYRPLNDFALDNLKENTIWLSDINTLNDPYEAEILFDTTELFRNFFLSDHFASGFKSQFGFQIKSKDFDLIIKSENPFNSYKDYCNANGIIIDALNQNGNETDTFFESINNLKNTIKKQTRVFSMSERNDSILMWSHYAYHHQGICIEYDYSNSKSLLEFLQPVNYSNELFKILNLNSLNSSSIMMALLFKSIEWGYEKEWRLTVAYSKPEHNNKINAPVPKAIFIGTRFSLNQQDKQDQLVEICKENNIPIYQMKIHPQEYKVIEDYRLF